MSLRNQQQIEITDILLRDKTDGNPFATGAEGGALENFFIDQGKLVRATFMPKFHTEINDNSVWALKEFNFTRDGAPEKQLLIFKSNGRVYRRRGGEEVQVYPENESAATAGTSDSGFAGTGATTAGDGTDWSNATNITGASDTTYATSANTGTGSSSSGPLSPGTASVGGSGTAWSNPNNILTNNDTNATVVNTGNWTSEYLQATNFGFAIPSTATISGIIAEIEFQGSSGVTNTSTLIIKGGSRVGTDHADGTSGVAPSYTTYGSTTDLWGATWTPAEVNASNFGVAFSVSGTNTGDVEDALVDHMRVTVYYGVSTTDLLNATNYGHAVSGEVAGITVRVRGKVVVTSGSANSQMVCQLRSAGAVVGTTISQSFTSTTDTQLTFGGATTLWGASWTSTLVNASAFGVSLYCEKDASPVGVVSYSIDSVEIEVAAAGGSAVTGALFTRKPAFAQLNNRLHVSDGRIYRIYNGWNWVTGGLTAPNAAADAISGTGLTGTYIFATTAVHIRSNNGVDTRIHESSRTYTDEGSDGIVLANQGLAITLPTSLPARATHWSVYVNEVAGSTVLRRHTTVPITTTTVTVTTEPVSTAAIAPIRNDPVQPSRVLCQWKNRIAMRSETNPDQLWFTAFGEVTSQLNGAGEESLPGRSTDSISDLVNSWTIPDGGQPMQAACYHREHLFVFTDRTGFYIEGEGALLDNTGLRDFRPQRQFSFGAAGPTSVYSTPHGLVVISPEHKLWFWTGSETVDLGHDIQGRLDDLTEDELSNIEMIHWSGEGWDWLLVSLPDRVEVFDFALATDKAPYGSWQSLGSQNGLPQPTCFAAYNPGRSFLLSGHADGTVHQLATICQPSHLGLSCILGETYLSASVQNSPTCIARTGPIHSATGQWSDNKYLQYYHVGHTDAGSISTTDPTITAYYDQTNPAAPDSGVELTSSTVEMSNERRAWFRRSAALSGGGALAREVHVEIKWTTTDDDSAARPQVVNNEVLKLSLVSQPKAPLTL